MTEAVSDFYSNKKLNYDEIKVLDGTVDFGSNTEFISRSGIKKDIQTDAIEIILDLVREGKLDPWNIDIVDLYDKYMKRISELKQDNLYDVPNYGSASAPFYLALCIWVGALLLSSVFTVHFKLDDTQKYLYTFKQRFNGRYLTFGFLNQLQAISAALGNLFILHAYTKFLILLINNLLNHLMLLFLVQILLLTQKDL